MCLGFDLRLLCECVCVCGSSSSPATVANWLQTQLSTLTGHKLKDKRLFFFLPVLTPSTPLLENYIGEKRMKHVTNNKNINNKKMRAKTIVSSYMKCFKPCFTGGQKGSSGCQCKYRPLSRINIPCRSTAISPHG